MTNEELLAAINRRFDENQELLTAVNRRFDENQELLTAVNRRFDENERRWDENDRRWDENDRRWDENDRRWEENAEFRRHVDVRFEAVDDKFEQLLEAIGLVDWKLERFRKETTENFAGVDQRLSLLETAR